MTEDTIFDAASLTKVCATTPALMILLERGKIHLNDPVAKYIPEFKNVRVMTTEGAPPRAPSAPMTVRDLLLHTSGLSHRTSDLYQAERVRSRSDSMAIQREVVQSPRS